MGASGQLLRTRLSRRAFVGTLLASLEAATVALSARALQTCSSSVQSCTPPLGRGPQLPFLVGANYEGPSDRPWAMWRDNRFDPALIEADFARAASIGLRCLRLFVQSLLARDIKRHDWERLDLVVGLAQQYGLLLLLAFGDYDETLLGILGRDIGQVAARYVGHPAILGYDLRNEPAFDDLLIGRYPGYPDVPPLALQGPTLLETYGEWRTAEAVAARRQADPMWLPTRLTEEQAYWYANSLSVYGALQDAAADWAALSGKAGATILDYLAQPEAAAHWQVLLALINDALEHWLAALVGPIRKVDPSRPLTVGHNDLLLASLPANAVLDFVSLHHYPPADDAAPAYSAAVLSDLGARLGKPAVLSEFGWPTHEESPERIAALEAATIRELRQRGLAGVLKWMLNDIAGAEHTREGSFGLFTASGELKPSAVALQAAAS